MTVDIWVNLKYRVPIELRQPTILNCAPGYKAWVKVVRSVLQITKSTSDFEQPTQTGSGTAGAKFKLVIG